LVRIDPEGLTMTIQVKVQINIDAAKCLLALAAIMSMLA
jgi:hypothetical protein